MGDRLQKRYLEYLRVVYHLRRGWGRFNRPTSKLDGRGRTEFYHKIWRLAAEQLSAEFIQLPNGFCDVRLGGQVTRIYENVVRLDDPLTTRLVRVKPFVHKMLAEHGIPVPAYLEFGLGELEVAGQFLRKAGGPCVVKPAEGESAGNGVTTNIRTQKDLLRAAVTASLFSRELLMEHQVEGTNYRMLYADGKLLDVIRRRPPSIVGDGHSSLSQLIEDENRQRAKRKGGATLTRIQIDSDCRSTLRKAGLTLNSVLEAGREVEVKTVVNDNGDRNNISVRGEISDAMVREVGRASEVLGVRLAGIDVITKDPRVSLSESGGAIIEVNSSPGFHHHYNKINPDKDDRIAVPILRLLLGLPTEAGVPIKHELTGQGL